MASKLNYLSILTKIFAIVKYVKQWHSESKQDNTISKEEVTKLGVGLCAILGLRVSKSDQLPKP